MLVIKLNRGEEVIVTHGGEQLRIMVVRLTRDDDPAQQVHIRLGFEGPMSFNVVRKEVLDRKGESS
jgi:hypothetical protein